MRAQRAALVTGGGSGIGAAIARELAAAGHAIAVLDRDIDAARRSTDELVAAGAVAKAIVCDVLDENAVEAAVATTLKHFGRLDVAVNNAGIGHDMLPVHELPTATWRQVIDLDLTAVFVCMKHELPALERPGGVIVNVASEDATRGSPLWSALSAAKHGVLGLTRSAALEYARDGLRVNAVCPTRVETPLRHETPEELAAVLAGWPVPRLVQPEEVAQAVRWLASDHSAYVNGVALAIDGGMNAGLYGFHAQGPMLPGGVDARSGGES